MGEEAGTETPAEASTGDAALGFWARVQEHKIIQWGLAYLGAALALAHGEELVGHAFHWPESLDRVLMIVLIAGFPIALTLAWYHGHRGLKRMSAGELTIISLLVLIGGVFFTASMRGSTEGSAGHDAAGAAAVAPREERSGSAKDASAAKTEPDTQRSVSPNSVAVLPFDNLSPERNDAYFAAGIHEEVLTKLAQLQNLTVISRTSVARYAGTTLSVPQIANELRVRTVLEGSVRYANNRVRITAQLIDAATDQPMWSDAYERDLADVFAVQADIAMNIANALRAEFSPAEQKTLEQKPTTSAAAYALYLQAMSIFRQSSPGSIGEAQTLLDRATAIDPQFGRAYGVKARLYAASFNNTGAGAGVAPEDRAELERRVRENAQRALAIDPADGGARSALRGLNLTAWRWSVFSHIEPGDDAEFPELWVLAWMGNSAEALRAGKRGVELNPNDPGFLFTLGVLYAYLGDRAASIRTLERAAELAPANVLTRLWLAFDAIALGNTTDALANLQLVEQLLGDTRPIVFLPELAYAYARIGRPDDARRLFGEIQALGKTADLGAGTWAGASLAVGDEKEALRWLEVAAAKTRRHEPDSGLITLMNLKMNVLANPLLKEPAFANVLGRIRGDYP